MTLNGETHIPTAARTSAASGRPTRIRWYVGALIFVICFVAYLDRIVFSVSATSIMDDLHITPVQFGVITTLFNVGYFVFQIPAGIFIQRVGTRRAMTVALLLWSVFTGMTGIANGLLVMAVSRMAFGAGEAPLFPTANTIFARWFPPRERGKATSLMNSGAFLGTAIGASLLVPIIQHLSWRGAFFTCAVLGCILTAVSYLFLRDHPGQHSKTNEAEVDLIDESADLPAVTGSAPWRLFLRQRSFWALAVAFFGTLWTIQFFVYWLPYYLQHALSVPFPAVGGYTSIAFTGITVSVLIAGLLSDRLLRAGRSRFQSRNLVAVAGLAVAAVCLVLSLTGSTVLVSVIWLSVALGGAGFAQTLAWAIATDIGRAHTAAVGSWMNAWGFVAAAIVPTLAPVLARDLGWTPVILVNAAVAVLGIAGFLFTRTNHPLRVTRSTQMS